MGVNIRPRDLAMHIYKLSTGEYLSYEFQSGNVNVMLTEKGFAQVKAGMPPKPTPPQAAAQATMLGQQVQRTAMMQPPEMMLGKPAESQQKVQEMQHAQQLPTQPKPEDQLTPELPKGHMLRNAIIVLIIIIIIALGYLYYAHYISL
jgi:hypothetical protein